LFFSWLNALGLSAYIDSFREQNLYSLLQLDDFSLDVSICFHFFLEKVTTYRSVWSSGCWTCR